MVGLKEAEVIIRYANNPRNGIEKHIEEMKEFILSKYNYCKFDIETGMDYTAVAKNLSKYRKCLYELDVREMMEDSGISDIRVHKSGNEIWGEKVYDGVGCVSDGMSLSVRKKVDYQPYLDELIRVVNSINCEENRKYLAEHLEYRSDAGKSTDRDRYWKALESEDFQTYRCKKGIKGVTISNNKNNGGLDLMIWK